jgi:glycopeptide antibiotics resistance protein
MDYLITDIGQYTVSVLNGMKEHRTVSMMFLLVAALILIFLKQKAADRILLSVLVIYLYLIFLSTVLMRSNSGAHEAMLVPFWSYREAISKPYFRYEILENILLFVPAGLLLKLYNRNNRRKQSFFNSMIFLILFSAGIETLQYFLKVGLCEFDDVFNNTLGGMAGYGIASLVIKLVKSVSEF